MKVFVWSLVAVGKLYGGFCVCMYECVYTIYFIFLHQKEMWEKIKEIISMQQLSKEKTYFRFPVRFVRMDSITSIQFICNVIKTPNNTIDEYMCLGNIYDTLKRNETSSCIS